MLATVVIVNVTVLTSAGTPSSATLDGLKLQAAPAGRPAVQLPGLEITPGLDTIEFVKLTVPVKPVVGVRVMTEVAVCPAGTLRAVGLAFIVNGIVTFTTAGVGETELVCDVSPS